MKNKRLRLGFVSLAEFEVRPCDGTDLVGKGPGDGVLPARSLGECLACCAPEHTCVSRFIWPPCEAFFSSRKS